MASTLITYYVNTSSTAGGDGTTNDITGVSRAFAGLNEAWTFISTTHTDLVTEDIDIELHCSGGQDDIAGFEIRDLITDDTHTIKIIAPTQDWVKSSGYRIVSSTIGSGDSLIYFASNMHVELINLKVILDIPAGILFRVKNSFLVLTNCYLSSINTVCGINILNRGVVIKNSLIKDTASIAISYSNAFLGDGNVILDHVTCIGSTVVATDLFLDVLDSYITTITVSANTSLTNVATSDATGTMINVVEADVFTDPTNEDYTPQGALLGAGTLATDIGAIQVSSFPNANIDPLSIEFNVETLTVESSTILNLVFEPLNIETNVESLTAEVVSPDPEPTPTITKTIISIGEYKVLRNYGTTTTIGLPLREATEGTLLDQALFSLEVGDVQISKDGSPWVNITNLPTKRATGEGILVSLSASEMGAKEIEVKIVDQTDPKVFMDQYFTIDTIGDSQGQLDYVKFKTSLTANDVLTAINSATYDGLTTTEIQELTIAFMKGNFSVTGVDSGTLTINLFKQDGLTLLYSFSVDEASGARTVV